ncbi:MAG: glycerol-3-phosphate dehydrogenase/oxidase [Bacteroidota bacterium]
MNYQNPSFSALQRTDILEKLKTEFFDLVVIGGGATGCGIALDAASRGLKTALIEKSDFASGTSSKSTKLIHGGLRYLKQLDIGLVRETGTERAVVHRLAPHLVLPEKMLMPLVKGGTYGKWATSFGLKVYDILAGVEGDDRRRMLSKKETLALEPLLEEEGLEGGGYYAEYRTDDARLTIENIKTAVQHGALALNYCKAIDFKYNDDSVKGLLCKDEINGEQFEIKSKKVVAAGGPWVDNLRKKDGALGEKRLHLTKGIHLVFPHAKFPLKQTTYFDGPDGRMIFAIPRGRITYVGTTDTNYTANLNRVICTKADAAYVLRAIHHAFPSVKVNEKDIISNWAGLRPLIHEEGKSPSELSRKDEIFISKSGLIAIAGGKLTGYRKMAQRIVDLVTEQMEGATLEAFKKCHTKNIYLTPEPFKNYGAVKQYISELENIMDSIGLDKYYAWYLTTNYGRQTGVILDKLRSFEDTPEVALARAEVWFGVYHEMVTRADDYFVRRSGRLFFDIQTIAEIRAIVMEDLKNYLNWDAHRLAEENEKLEALLYDATHYYDDEYALQDTGNQVQ